MAGDKENPLPPEGQGDGAPAVEGATKMFSMKLDAWLSDFSPGDLLGEGGWVHRAPRCGAAPPRTPCRWVRGVLARAQLIEGYT